MVEAKMVEAIMVEPARYGKLQNRLVNVGEKTWRFWFVEDDYDEDTFAKAFGKMLLGTERDNDKYQPTMTDLGYVNDEIWVLYESYGQMEVLNATIGKTEVIVLGSSTRAVRHYAECAFGVLESKNVRVIKLGADSIAEVYYVEED